MAGFLSACLHTPPNKGAPFGTLPKKKKKSSEMIRLHLPQHEVRRSPSASAQRGGGGVAS